MQVMPRRPHHGPAHHILPQPSTNPSLLATPPPHLHALRTSSAPSPIVVTTPRHSLCSFSMRSAPRCAIGLVTTGFWPARLWMWMSALERVGLTIAVLC